MTNKGRKSGVPRWSTSPVPYSSFVIRHSSFPRRSRPDVVRVGQHSMTAGRGCSRAAARRGKIGQGFDPATEAPKPRAIAARSGPGMAEAGYSRAPPPHPHSVAGRLDGGVRLVVDHEPGHRMASWTAVQRAWRPTGRRHRRRPRHIVSGAASLMPSAAPCPSRASRWRSCGAARRRAQR